MSDDHVLPYRLGVGIALFNRQGQVFVAQRIDIHQDAWQMPQGGIDAGEDPPNAALRELAEETSITSARIIGEVPDWLTYDLPKDLLGVAWQGKYRGQRQKWFAALFEGAESEINLATEHPEFTAWRWADLSDLAHGAVDFKRPIYQAVATTFQPIASALASGSDL